MECRESGFARSARRIAEGVESLEELDLLSDERLKAVWGVRQEQLREASEQLSDNAKRLKRRIAALEGFRARTSARCDAAADPTTPVVTAASDEDERSAVDELESLEYELGDVDDARDFHGALGGLPPLALSRRRTVSLVSRARASLTGIFARARFSSEEEEEESQVALLSPRFSRAVRAAAARHPRARARSERKLCFFVSRVSREGFEEESPRVRFGSCALLSPSRETRRPPRVFVFFSFFFFVGGGARQRGQERGHAPAVDA